MPPTPRRWTDPSTLTFVGLLAVTWLGVHASWGLTDPGDTLLSGPMRAVASLQIWLLGAVVLLGGAMVVAWRRQGAVALVARMVVSGGGNRDPGQTV